MKKGRHAPSLLARLRSRRVLRLGLLILGALGLLVGGVAYAGYRYEAARADQILPGVSIGGVDVSGMGRAQAVAAVSRRAGAELDREIVVRAGKRDWHVTPDELGTTARLEAVVDQALGLNEELPWRSRLFHRLFHRPVEERFDLSLSADLKQIRNFVDVVSDAVRVSPTNAAVALEDGEVVLRRPDKGIRLKAKQAQKRLLGAVRGDQDEVNLRVREIEPKVTPKELGQTIVVSLSELELKLYEGLKVVKTYPVAGGLPEYPTPKGEWTLYGKNENPTWTNPDPDGWGAGMPARIGPGPGNPLGTHAMYLDAPGIRIHGTYDEGSIGSYASHGCVRMTIEDSKELFAMVDVDIPVLII